MHLCKTMVNCIHLPTLIFIFLIFASTFGILLPFFIWNYPFSAYYHLNKEDALQIISKRNNERISEAMDYFEHHKDNMYNFHYRRLQTGKLFLLVTIITTSRKDTTEEPLKYLTQTVISSHREIIENEDIHAAILICNVNSDPLTHNEATSLSQHFPTVIRQTKNIILDVYEKEKQDYVFCLEQSQLFNPHYILVLEDDSVPRKSMLPYLKYVIDYKVTAAFERGELKNKLTSWLALKLYYPESWMGFAFEWSRILQLMGVGFIFGGLYIFVATFLSTWVHIRYNSLMLYAILLLGTAYGILVAQVIGRQNLLEFYCAHPMLLQVITAPGCCTPSTLYPVHQLSRLIIYLNSTKCKSDFGIDLAIDNYAKQNQLTIYQLEPNLFHHIGFHSSLSNDLKVRLEEFLL